MTQATSNQLKFNLDAIVNNLNMVNLVHKPKPILIEKINNLSNDNNYGRNRIENTNAFRNDVILTGSNFEFIDETKMSMYSYLVQRELKTKEWLSKYELDQNNSNGPKTNSLISNNIENKIPVTNKNQKSKNSNVNKQTAFQTTSNDSKPKNESNSGTNIHVNGSLKPKNELNDLKKCCDDTVKSIENLERQLNEFKHERLKIVFNDPVEEEKQKRIQLEQIKYLSRSMYNLKNQMTQFKFNNIQKAENQNKATITPIARLAHTMRQVNKLAGVFADFYPYREDNNLISEKLCFHFYKQLQASIQKFSEQIQFIPIENSKTISTQLASMISNCDKYFGEFSQSNNETESHTTETRSSKQQLSTKPNILNVIRTARTGVSVSKIGTSIESKKVKNKSGASLSIASASAIVPIKKILPKSRMNIIDAKSDEESVIRLPVRLDISPPPVSKSKITQNVSKKKKSLIKPKNEVKKQTKTERNETTFRSKNRERKDNYEFHQEDLNVSSESNAFKHSSSPNIHIKNFRTNRRSRSAEKLQQKNFTDRMHRSNSIEKYRSLSNDLNNSTLNETTQSRASNYKPDFKYFNHEYDDDYDNLTQDYLHLKRKYGSSLENLRASFSKTHDDNFNNSFQKMSILKKKSMNISQTPSKLISRIDTMKRENDLIRQKYEKLKYHESLIERNSLENKTRRPYEECYLVNEAVVREEYEAKIDFNKIYKELRHPNVKQLNRVIDYANKFRDYTEKTSVTTIGNSQFDDFELFELLSDSLFDDCMVSIYEELEGINDELALNLMNAEFDITSQEKQKNNESILISKRKSFADSKKIIAGTNQNNTSYSSFHTETFNPEEVVKVNEGNDYDNENENDTFTSISSSNV